MSTNLRYVRIVPVDASVSAIREIKIEDAPGGLAWQRTRIKPIFSRRVQSGTLITQVPRYNKNRFSLAITLWEPDIEEYFSAFFDSGESFLIEIPKVKGATLEFSGLIHIVDFGTGYDFTNNLRSIELDVEEV